MIAALLVLVFAWMLNTSYEFVETELFAYQGLVWNPPGFEILTLGYLLAAAPCLWIPMELRRPSDLALWLTYITLVVPLCFFPFHVSHRDPMEVLGFVLPMLAAFPILCGVVRIPNFRIRPIPISHRGFFWILLVLIGVTTFVVASTNGFRFNLSLEDAYVRRLEARETAGQGSLAGYSLAWLAGSLAPLGIAYGLLRRNLVLVGAGVFGLLAIFSFSGTKSSLFTPLIMLALLWLVRSKRSRVLNLMLIGTTLMVAVSAISWLRAENPILSESFTRRLIISKGVSSTFYWQTYENDPVYMRDSIVARLVGLPEVTEKSFQIGLLYGMSDQENYNSSAWSNGYANFGLVGILLTSIVIGLALKLVDSMAEYGNFEVLCVTCAFYAIVWGEQALETSLMSSGILLSLVLLLFLSGTGQARTQSLPEVAPAGG